MFYTVCSIWEGGGVEGVGGLVVDVHLVAALVALFLYCLCLLQLAPKHTFYVYVLLSH